MKKLMLILALGFISTTAFAAPTFEKLVNGEVAVWNLAQANGGIATTIYITGDAARELYDNLDVKEFGLSDEYGHPTGGSMKAGKNLVCSQDSYPRSFKCAVNFDGKSGAVAK